MNWIKKLFHLSPAEVLSVIAKPRMISVLLAAPRSFNVYDTVKFFLKDARKEEVENLRVQFLRNHRFFEELNEKMVARRARRVSCEGWPEFLYVLIRLSRPEIIVETGVFDGISSAVILQALGDNGAGRSSDMSEHRPQGAGNLISIDLPATTTIDGSTHRMKETTLPEGMKPGWVIPDYLRARHKIILGGSKEFLPEVLKENPNIDIFLHDSLHTYEYQKFEYETAWPKIKEGGWLLSDDVLWTPAFHEFSKKVKRPYRIYYGLGILKK